MTDAKSAGDQCDSLITLSVAYQGARDITQEVLRIAFGNHFLATARPVWPQPFLSVQQKREKTKALDRFLNQSKDVIRKVLRETNDAIDGLVASGTDVSPTWLVADPLNGFLGALPIAEIVQVAVVQDAEFESAIQSISKELVVLNRKVNSEIANLEVVIGALGEYDIQFLIAMRKLGATFPESKKTIPQIVYRISPSADANSGYKKCSPKLQRTNPPLIVKCETDGFYLSSHGATAAERLDNRRTSLRTDKSH